MGHAIKIVFNHAGGADFGSIGAIQFVSHAPASQGSPLPGTSPSQNSPVVIGFHSVGPISLGESTQSLTNRGWRQSSPFSGAYINCYPWAPGGDDHSKLSVSVNNGRVVGGSGDVTDRGVAVGDSFEKLRRHYPNVQNAQAADSTYPGSSRLWVHEGGSTLIFYVKKAGMKPGSPVPGDAQITNISVMNAIGVPDQEFPLQSVCR